MLKNAATALKMIIENILFFIITNQIETSIVTSRVRNLSEIHFRFISIFLRLKIIYFTKFL